MTNPNTIDNTHPTDEYMGNYGWFPWEDGFHFCDIMDEVNEDISLLHDVGTPSLIIDHIGNGPLHSIITEDGMFCSKSCAKTARENRFYENALNDRESWYWESHSWTDNYIEE